jgi:hypothetical protein
VFACTVDLAPNVGFLCSWYRWKACTTLSLKVLNLWETELGLERYGLASRGHRSVFGLSEDIFPIEIPARPGKILAIRELHVLSECESGRLCARARHPPGGNYEIFSIVLFLLSVFARTVDVVPDIRFRQSWRRRKACVTFFLKVRSWNRGNLGFARCGPANRGRWNASHAGGSFSYRDSGLTGGALDNSRVARCN